MTKRKKPEDFKKTGRATVYSEELADKLCDIIASTNMSTKWLCAENPIFPSLDTLFKWITKYPIFSDKYYHAKKVQAQVAVDQILEIADESDKTDKARLQVDTRKWVAERMLPKVYGNHEELREKNEMLKELLSLREQLAEKNKKEF